MREPDADMIEVSSGRRAVGVVSPPGSKSHAMRLLILAALAEGESCITGVPDSEDVRALIAALRAMGIDLDEDGDAVTVRGCGGLLPDLGREVSLEVQGSGTALRLLTVICCLGPGPYVIDGDASLRARPLGGVLEVVRSLGCEAVSANGCAPVRVSGGPIERLPTDLPCPDVSRSSQPLSALVLLSAVLPTEPPEVSLPPDAVSLGYVNLALHSTWPFNGHNAPGAERRTRWRDTDGGDGWLVSADGERWTGVKLPFGGLVGGQEQVQGDWSSAAYLLAAAVVTHGDVGLTRWMDTIQPDIRIVKVLEAMGAHEGARDDGVDWRMLGTGRLVGATVSLREAPDLAPLVGALGCVADGTTVVTDAPHLRIKESDRIAATVAAARAIGCEAEERDDGFVIRGGGGTGGTVDPRGDHRIAMAFAVAGLAIPGVRIRDPGCVAKSYPGFWDDLARLTGGG